MRKMTLTKALSAWMCAGMAFLACSVQAEDLNAPAVVEITSKAAATDICPIGVNPDNFGGWNAMDYTQNQYVFGGGYEPFSTRWKGCVTAGGKGWFEADVMPPFWSSAFADRGVLDGARVRIYRMVKEDGLPLPIVPGPGWWKYPDYVDLKEAHHVVRLADTQIAGSSPAHPHGGYVNNRCTVFGPYLYGMRHIPYNLSWTDGLYHSPAKATYYYKVAAVKMNGKITPLGRCEEVRAAAGGSDNGPRIYNVADGFQGCRLAMDAGQKCSVNLHAKGGTNPLRWEIAKGKLPEGVALTEKNDGDDWRKVRATISGIPKTKPEPQHLVIRVIDAKGRSDERNVWINPAEPAAPAIYNAWSSSKPPSEEDCPLPPAGVKAVANADSITLSWQPSPDKDVAGYVIFRSDTLFDKQEKRVYLADPAIEPRPGDQVVIEWMSRGLPGPEHVPPGSVHTWTPLKAPFFNAGKIPDETRCELVSHPGQPLPAEFEEPGDTCLKITHPSDTVLSLEQFTFRVPPLAGSHMRAELWARQEGLPDGKIEFEVEWLDRAVPKVIHQWPLDDKWRKCEFEFDVPKTVSGYVRLKFKGPGTLWMDDFLMYRKDAKHAGPLTPGAEVFNELLSAQPETGKKGVLRYMRRIFDNEAPMDTLLKRHWMNPPHSGGFFYTQGYGCFHMLLEWCLATGDSPATRCPPQFTLRVEFSEEDWRHLVEYLAGPPDSPYGAVRTAQRGGNPTPWTDEFREIIIELGNESWHNGVIGGWTGYGIYGWVHGCGKEQGLFAKYFFDEVVGSMPLWRERDLGRKIKFAIDSNSGLGCDNYGETGMEFAKPRNVAYATHTAYVGPQWEYGQQTSSAFTDEGIQACLMASVANQVVTDDVAQMRDRINKACGLSFGNILYESGASGFDWRNSSNAATEQRYGHSLAMAVSALDAWLHCSYRGFKDMALYAMAQGSMWSSHVTGPDDLKDPMRPHPQWLALILRNRYARGTTMLETKDISMPTILWEEGWKKKAEKPLIRVYALKDKETYSVFVLSRKLDGKHNGRDFGDGFTPVTLRLPFAQARKIALHTLAGDPRSSNIDKRTLELQSKELPASVLKGGTLVVNSQSGGAEHGMPPGCIYLYVFEGLE